MTDDQFPLCDCGAPVPHFPCDHCDGHGRVPYRGGEHNGDCPACGGSGRQEDVPYDAWLGSQGIDPGGWE